MKRFIGVGGLVFLLVVALAAIGIGSALWSKVLVIEGTVNTGDLNADWDYAFTNDPTAPDGEESLDPCTQGLNPTDCVAPAKDVGSCDIIDGVGTQTLTIRVDNAYPSYECTITAAISNTGTIPFNVIGADIVSGDVPVEILDCTFPEDPQVDPGQSPDNEWEGSCTIHVLQEAEQEASYDVDVKICVAQWNEPTNYDECVNNPNVEGPRS